MPLLTTETETLTLSADEAKALAGYLTLMNSRERWAQHFAMNLNAILGHKDRRRALSPDNIAGALLNGLDQESGPAIHGMLYVDLSGTLCSLDGEESEAAQLEQYWILQRSGYWLAKFMGIELSCYADGKRRTPAQVLKNLENYIAEFDAQVETANEMIRDHSDLLTMPKAQTAAPAAAEPEEDPAPSSRTSPEMWADVTIRSLEEFAKDMPEALNLDQLQRLEKLSRKAPSAPKPRNRTTSITRSRKGKRVA